MKRFRYPCIFGVLIVILTAGPARNAAPADPVRPLLGDNLIGPVYPPPLGVDWSGSGSSGLAGGATWIYQNIILANFDTVYWGTVNDEIRVSFNDSSYSENEIMQFNPESSNPGSGVLVWAGTTFFPGTADTVFTRFTLRMLNYATGGTLAALPAGSVTLPENVGGVLWVINGLEYTVNFIFESSFSRDGPYQPALTFFDAHKPAGAIPYLSFLAGFYYVNTPPQLTANNALQIDEGQTAAITSDYLAAGDVESPGDRIFFNIAPGGLGGAPHSGWLRLDNDTLLAGDRFTMSDLENYRITYVHNGGENTLDNFTFNVTDGDGAGTPTGEFLTYTFSLLINPVNDPPVALSGAATARINTPLDWHFAAADVDTPAQTLYFSVAQDGRKGTTTILNDSTGLFRYQPGAELVGNDTVRFRVYDGYAYSDRNGMMVITIEDVPVLPQGHILIGRAGPCRILLVDPGNGEQTVYRDLFPLNGNPDLRLNDLILDPDGNLFGVTNDTGLVRVDYMSGETTVITPADSFEQPFSLDLSDQGALFVCDGGRGIIRIDPETGASAVLSDVGLFQFPVGIAAAEDGYLYVTDAGKLDSTDGRLLRIDPASGNLEVLSSGQHLADPAYLITLPGDKVCIADFNGFGGSGHILTVDLADGRQELISSGGHLVDPMGIGSYGSKLYVNNHTGGAIIEADMNNGGAQRIAFTDTTIGELFGLFVIQETITALPPAPAASPPETFILYQNYPNPFNPVTTIRYALPLAAQVVIDVYDVRGRKVAEPVNRYQKPGMYAVMFNTAGRASGIYIYRMVVAGRVVARKKMVVIK